MVQDEARRGNCGSGERSSQGEGEEEGTCTIMKLFGLGLGLGTKLFPHSHTDFKNISGYEDLKEIVKRALDSEENYNLLFVGAPASVKTLFLQGILEIREDVVYFDGSNTTSRILDVLEEKRPKIICIDKGNYHR